MPSVKMKTHKGTKARFKVSATGKVLHKPCGSSHLNSHKNGKKIRRLRKTAVLQNKKVAQTLRKVLLERNKRLMPSPVHFVDIDGLVEAVEGIETTPAE
jgi:large subunit ribosomal protein L35